MDENIKVDTNVVDIEVPCIVFFVLTPIFLVIRISSRVKTGSGLGWDDYTIIVSWVCSIRHLPTQLLHELTFVFLRHLLKSYQAS